MPSRVALTAPLSHSLVAGFAGVFLIVLGGSALATPDAQPFGVLCVGIGVLCVVLAVALCRRERLVLDTSGLEYKNLGLGLIPWTEISRISFVTAVTGATRDASYGKGYLAVTVKSPDSFWRSRFGERYQDLFPAGPSPITADEMYLNLYGVDTDRRQLRALVATFAPHLRCETDDSPLNPPLSPARRALLTVVLIMLLACIAVTIWTIRQFPSPERSFAREFRGKSAGSHRILTAGATSPFDDRVAVL